MVLSKTLYLLLSTGSNQEDLSQHDGKIVDWDIKRQTNKRLPSVTVIVDTFRVYVSAGVHLIPYLAKIFLS